MIRLLVEIEPDPYWHPGMTPAQARDAVDAAINGCHVHGIEGTTTVTVQEGA